MSEETLRIKGYGTGDLVVAYTEEWYVLTEIKTITLRSDDTLVLRSTEYTMYEGDILCNVSTSGIEKAKLQVEARRANLLLSLTGFCESCVDNWGEFDLEDRADRADEFKDMLNEIESLKLVLRKLNEKSKEADNED